MDGNLPYVSKAGTRAMGIGFLRRNEAGRHQKCRVTARKEMKHVKASSEDEEPLNTSLFFMKLKLQFLQPKVCRKKLRLKHLVACQNREWIQK